MLGNYQCILKHRTTCLVQQTEHVPPVRLKHVYVCTSASGIGRSWGPSSTRTWRMSRAAWWTPSSPSTVAPRPLLSRHWRGWTAMARCCPSRRTASPALLQSGFCQICCATAQALERLNSHCTVLPMVMHSWTAVGWSVLGSQGRCFCSGMGMMSQSLDNRGSHRAVPSVAANC